MESIISKAIGIDIIFESEIQEYEYVVTSISANQFGFKLLFDSPLDVSTGTQYDKLNLKIRIPGVLRTVDGSIVEFVEKEELIPQQQAADDGLDGELYN